MMWKHSVGPVAVGIVVGTVMLAVWWGGLAKNQGKAEPAFDIPASQQALLAASDVEGAYSAAGDQVLSCLRERGVPEPISVRGADGTLQFSWAGSDTREQARAYGDIYKACYFEYMDDIDRAWQTSDTTVRAATERGVAVLACVKEKHPELQFARTTEELMPQLAKVDQLPGNPLSLCIATVGGGSNQIKFVPPSN
jgi:hypothetical protein